MDVSTTALLKDLPVFAALDEESVRDLASRCRRRTFRAGEALFHEGDPGFTLYVVISGAVNIQRDIDSTGVTVHLATRGPGEPFGEMALIDGKPRMADAVTAAPTDALMLDRDVFVAAVEKSPRIAFAVMSYLADRLREAGGQMEERQALDVRGRLAQRLLDLADRAGSPDSGTGILLPAHFTQQQLAEHIGATRETVNRELSRMREVRAIRMEGRRIVVTDLDKLRRYACP
jgi:CRP/FNR family cyclic AMP-dependent transcriptional regulator